MILWTDIETTGLEPAHDDILELALVVTNDNLEIVGSKSWLIRPHYLEINRWSVDVRTMHANSGLVNDILKFGKLKDDSCVGVHEEAQQFLMNNLYRKFLFDVPKSDLVPLAGSSVHFDREFLKRHFPNIWAHVSYRNIDVSTIRSLVQRWRPDIEPWKKSDAHRALPDVLDSIEELKYYKKILWDGSVHPPFEFRALNH